MVNFSPFRTLCGPQVFDLIILGRSIPSNDVVLTNPSPAGTHVWTGNFVSTGGSSVQRTDSVVIGTDSDSDGLVNASDNCPTVPNPDQRNINPLDGAGDACDPDDFDLDTFSDRIEYFAGTDPGASCATNPTHNAWPADINNDGASDITDRGAVAASFGQPVPPAPARHNIAPDPPDGAVDITDVGRMAGLFGQGCDADGDGIPNVVDNCLTIANPDQRNINPDGVGDACDPDDFDLDTFSDRIEYFAGTDPGAPCATTPTHNAWPADINNDGASDITDRGAVAASFGQPVPPAPARHNIAPDPPDGAVDITDVGRMAGLFGTSC
jgi:hypothetical protein